MTCKHYLAEPHATRMTAIVVDLFDGGTGVVRLDRTIFHPQGGGQKADRGRIGAATVLHVAHSADHVDHHVQRTDGLRIGMEVDIEIDAGWRALNAVYHTAGHLLAAVVEALHPGLRAVAGHQWPGEGRVEFVGDVSVEALCAATINAVLAHEVSAELPVTVEGDPFGDRAIRIGGYPAIPCGGTHVRNLADVNSVNVRSVKCKSGRVRISYDASPGGLSVVNAPGR